MGMHPSDGHIWFPFGTSQDGRYGDIGSSNDDTILKGIPVDLIGLICQKHNDEVFQMQEEAREKEEQMKKYAH